MTPVDFSHLEPAEPPAALGFPPRLVEQVTKAHRIMLERGSVTDGATYGARHRARWRAERLKRLIARLELEEAWRLRQRTWQIEPGRWRWAVEYIEGGGEQNGD